MTKAWQTLMLREKDSGAGLGQGAGHEAAGGAGTEPGGSDD